MKGQVLMLMAFVMSVFVAGANPRVQKNVTQAERMLLMRYSCSGVTCEDRQLTFVSLE